MRLKQQQAERDASSSLDHPAGVANNILQFNGNRDLVLNMLNWLSSDEDLISIRPKEPEDRRLSLIPAANVYYLLHECYCPAIDHYCRGSGRCGGAGGRRCESVDC